jgi:hypothetical protein
MRFTIKTSQYTHYSKDGSKTTSPTRIKGNCLSNMEANENFAIE